MRVFLFITLVLSVRLVIAQSAGGRLQPGEVLINELLYEAVPSDAEYIELYNSGSRDVPYSDILIAKRDKSGKLTSVKSLPADGRRLPPGGLVWVCYNFAAVEAAYTYLCADNCVEMPSKLSYSDAGGTVVVLNSNREVVDELAYGRHLHHTMASKTKGVALEKGYGADGLPAAGRWSSAGGDADNGYGSPGMPNRVGRMHGGDDARAVVQCRPTVFTPDGDGYEDEVEVSVCVEESDFSVRILIYDASGRCVRRLANSVAVASRGGWKWDGRAEDGRLLPAGIYVVYAGLTSPRGQQWEERKVCVLSR